MESDTTMNANDPQVSAIVPTRDRPELLRRALRAIAAQADEGLLEIVVVYDQSEPDLSLIDEFAPVSVNVVSNERLPGLAGARNTGILAAKGSWIAFCDDDDVWSQDKLLQQRAALVRNPDADFLVGNITIAIGDKRIERSTELSEITIADLIRDRVMEAHPSTFLVRRAAIDDYLGFVDEDLPGSYAEDYDWLLRAARQHPIVVADAPIATVQWHRKSYFGNRWQMIDDALGFLVEKTPEFQDDPKGLARIMGQRAFAQAAQGHSRQAVGTAWQTVKLDWTQLRAYASAVVASHIVSADRLVRWANATGRGF